MRKDRLISYNRRGKTGAESIEANQGLLKFLDMNNCIALVTERRYVDQPINNDQWYLKNIFDEDRLLSQALRDLGLETVRVDWSDKSVDWPAYRACVIRTTWDYFDRYGEFCEWLERRQSDAHVLNPPDLLKWNADKHYLADLAASNVAIVPTVFLKQGDKPELQKIFDQLQVNEAILKPCVSGAARNTFRLPTDDLQAWQAKLDLLLPHESMMIQPFQSKILSEGEITLVVMGGRVTHAVRKVAKAGDFRVQDDHGGKVFEYQPTREEVEFAELAFAACRWKPVYGRVDTVRSDEGQLQVMELELIEPELWMRFCHASAVEFARAIVAEL